VPTPLRVSVILVADACIVSSSSLPDVSTVVSRSTVLVNWTNTSSGPPPVVVYTSHEALRDGTTAAAAAATDATSRHTSSLATEVTAYDVTGYQSTSRDRPDLHKASLTTTVSTAVAAGWTTSSSSSSSSEVQQTSSKDFTAAPSRSLTVSSTDDISSTIPDSSPSTADLWLSVDRQHGVAWTSALVVALCLTALIVLLVVILVCLLRARSRHKLCWTTKRCYFPVQLFYQNGSRADVVLDPSSIPAAVNNGGPTKGPELAPLTYV